MKVAYHPNTYVMGAGSPDVRSTLTDVMRRADQAGVSAIALMDHFLPIGPASDPMLEGYTALGYVAACTESADLMLLVSGVTHRHPVLLAKAVTTLDVLSAGRARLGIGAAWYERENTAYGLPFPDLPQRFEILDETLRIIRALWSPDDHSFSGTRFTLGTTQFSPMPLRRPAPPILVGGNGRRRTLQLVARHGDACNFLLGPDNGGPPLAAELIEILHSHCAAEGRQPEQISKTMLYTAPVGTDADGVARFAEQMRGYAAMGIEEVFVMPIGATDQLRFVDALGTHLIPAVHDATADLPLPDRG